MPRRPASPRNATIDGDEMSMNMFLVATAGRLSNTQTTPPCSTTNQWDVSLGGWSIATGALNASAGNTRSRLRATCGGPGGKSPPPSPLGQPAARSTAAAAAGPTQRRNISIDSLSPACGPIMARPPGKLYRGAMTVLASFKARAAELKREVLAIYLAAKHPRTPWYAKALLVAIVAYVLSPIDLIPDFIPVLGLLDEIVLLPFALVLVVKLVPEDVMAECRSRALERRPEGAALGRIGAAFIVLVWIALIVLAMMWMS